VGAVFRGAVFRGAVFSMASVAALMIAIAIFAIGRAEMREILAAAFINGRSEA
jgi:hypothetical protein